MSTGTYAATTTVPVAKTKTEIEETLARYGATGFGYMSQGRTNVVMFEMQGRRVLLRVTIPDPDSREMRYGAGGRSLSERQRAARIAQVERQRWRALLLVIKAKLESVESRIESFDQAWLPHIVIPSTGQTYGDFAIPQLQDVYEHHELPPMLPGARVIQLPERTS